MEPTSVRCVDCQRLLPVLFFQTPAAGCKGFRLITCARLPHPRTVNGEQRYGRRYWTSNASVHNSDTTRITCYDVELYSLVKTEKGEYMRVMLSIVLAANLTHMSVQAASLAKGMPADITAKRSELLVDSRDVLLKMQPERKAEPTLIALVGP
jgi:hypothetical protein